MSDSINQSMSDEAVCRTAPATPGLSNMHDKNLEYFATYTQFLRDLHTIAIFSSIANIFSLSY